MAMRYSGDEYLFAFTYDQVGFAHVNPKLVGKDDLYLKDADGLPIITALLKIRRTQGQGTYSYSCRFTPTIRTPRSSSHM